jgi:hypothetical protein
MLDTRMGEPHNQSGRLGKENSCTLSGLNFNPSALQPILSRCTDCAILASVIAVTKMKSI